MGSRVLASSKHPPQLWGVRASPRGPESTSSVSQHSRVQAAGSQVAVPSRDAPSRTAPRLQGQGTKCGRPGPAWCVWLAQRPGWPCSLCFAARRPRPAASGRSFAGVFSGSSLSARRAGRGGLSVLPGRPRGPLEASVDETESSKHFRVHMRGWGQVKTPQAQPPASPQGHTRVCWPSVSAGSTAQPSSASGLQARGLP